MFRRLLSTLFLVGLIGGSGYWIYAKLQPCAQPVSYSVGAIDERFNVSREQMEQAVIEAAQVWSDLMGRPMFTRKEEGGLVIEAMFDRRQETQNKLESLGLIVDSGKQTYEQWKAKYESFKSKLEAAQQQYDTLKAQYEKLSAAYDAAVEKGKREGVTPEQADSIERQRLSLNAVIEKVNVKGRSVQELVDTVNAVVTKLNQVGHATNEIIDQYQDAGDELPDEYQAGVYTRDVLHHRIDVYAFDDQADLRRLLMHELGHALGLDHVEDANAIMYRLNESKNDTPTEADKAELRRVCKL